MGPAHTFRAMIRIYILESQCEMIKRTILRTSDFSCENQKRLEKVNTLYKENPAGSSLLKANNRKTRTRCEICSKLTIKIPNCRRGSVI